MYRYKLSPRGYEDKMRSTSYRTTNFNRNYSYVCAKCHRDSCRYTALAPTPEDICGECQYEELQDRLANAPVEKSQDFKSHKNCDGKWDPKGAKSAAKFFGKNLTSNDFDVWKAIPGQDGTYDLKVKKKND